MKNEFGLPDDYWTFVAGGEQLVFDPQECEAGPVFLRQPQDLKLERLLLETYHSSFHEEDPHLNDRGFYYVSVVPLTTGNYVTYGVLLWLPQETTFATYEDSHHDLLVFPNATWSQIVADPLRYLNAHWEVDGDARNSDFVLELKPWPNHPFLLGFTLEEVEKNRQVNP